ncbi:phage scaffolding protein [Leuconostoc sp. MS02]|uniref:Phage scaffolding protein n=1 Tax=Leuconostoc aquikimchii TaxID=3236804 RepID=A0ABV3S3N2_9LACO
MNTEDLKKLGLDGEQVKGVMALKGELIKHENTKLDAITAERDTLSEQMAQRDKDIKDLKKNSGDNEELSGKLSDLQNKYDTDTQTLNDKLAATKLDSALSEALVKTKARDPQDLKAFLNMEEIKLNDDGELSGLNDQITQLQDSKGYLFDGGTQQGYKPTGGGISKQSNNLSEAMKSKDFNFTEFLKQSQGE